MKEKIIYEYKVQGGDGYLNNARPYFRSDQLLIFTTGRFAIGFDLENEIEIFRTESEGFYSLCISNKPLVFKDKRVLLG